MNPESKPYVPPALRREPPDSWTTPLHAHRVVANLYAVGTMDLGMYLVVTDAGHILINTGVHQSDVLIRNNLASLGFDLEDVKILLSTQSHWDHTGALAEVKRQTGARLWATTRDAHVLRDGGYSDPQFGGGEMFEPVEVDELVVEGDVVELGGTELKVHIHPGHTEGSSSYTMTAHEEGREIDVAIVNMGTVNPGKRLLLEPTYPGVNDDFAETFAKQKDMNPDVWVAAHGSHYAVHDKYRPGQEYRATTFADQSGFQVAVAAMEKKYLDYLAAERSRRSV